MFGSGSPALNESTFQNDFGRYGAVTETAARSDLMSISGTIGKSLILLAVVAATAIFTWNQTMDGTNPMPWVFGGGIGGFVLALVTIFKPAWSPVTAPLYAAAEGLFLGAISAVYAVSFSPEGGLLDNIVFQAAGLTVASAAAMLILYAFRIIRVTEKFRSVMMVAIGAVFLFYIASFVLGLFGVSLPMIHGGGPIAIGISAVIVIIASLSLLLDFDLIERGAASGAPKHMEWYGGFALLVTLIWLYLAMLRLLSQLAQSD